MPVEPANIADSDRDLPHSPPLGAHLPPTIPVIGLPLLRRGLPHEPSSPAKLPNRPADLGFAGLGPFPQWGDDLVAELEDLQGVTLGGDKETGIRVEERGQGDLRDLGQVQIVERWWGPDLLRCLLARGAGRSEEGIEIADRQIRSAKAKFLQMFGQGRRSGTCSEVILAPPRLRERSEDGSLGSRAATSFSSRSL